LARAGGVSVARRAGVEGQQVEQRVERAERTCGDVLERGAVDRRGGHGRRHAVDHGAEVGMGQGTGGVILGRLGHPGRTQVLGVAALHPGRRGAGW
jgi:hypothetical protein